MQSPEPPRPDVAGAFLALTLVGSVALIWGLLLTV
jgi:hypothetical protein